MELNMRFAIMEKLFVINLDVLHPKFKKIINSQISEWLVDEIV